MQMVRLTMNTDMKIFTGLSIALLITLIITIVLTVNAMNMFGTGPLELPGGYYKTTGYYCVSTLGTPSFVESVEVHEQCHALVESDYNHFCGHDYLEELK